MNNIIKRVWNQNRMVNIEDLRGMAFQAEDGGHTFEISGINDASEAVELSGTVAGVFMRPDGTDVALTGTASDGVVSVTLSDACYAVDGRFGLYIFVTSNSKKTCVYACIGTVAQSSYGTVAGDTPQNVVDLINAINAAVATIPADYSDLMAAIAPTYSDQSVYPAGAYRWYNGVLYKSKVAITTAESFTAAHWKTVALADDVSDLQSALDEAIEDFAVPTQEAVDNWLAAHPEATTTVQDSSLTEQKFTDSLKLQTIKDYVTPEMYGAEGDGVTDDTAAFQNAVDACCSNGSVLVLVPGKHYKLTATINITARMILDGSGAKVTSTAEWAFYVHSTNMWDGEFTVLRNMYLICVNGVKIKSIRTQLLNSRIQNTGTAILVLVGSYESIIDSCYLVSFTGQTSLGIQCEASDIIFNNITGYGQKIFIKNVGTSSIFNNIHGWPIDEDYEGSIFFYENSNAFSATLFNCHSDTYQYAIRSTASMNHIQANIKSFICNWSNKAEGWLFYAESDSVSKWAFMRADVSLNTLPTTFHICNVAGLFCLNNYNFKLSKDDIQTGANCYADVASIVVDGDILNVYIAGSVNTAQRTDLELYIPYCRYFGAFQSISVIINQQTYVGQIVAWGGDKGLLKIQCSNGFSANSGYVRYVVNLTRTLSFAKSYENDAQ